MKRALVLEGGAMRSVYSAGVLYAFTDFGIPHDYFDIVCATSAGACNAAYFISDQTNLYPEIWNNLITKEFVDHKNFIGRKPVLNIDHMLQNIMKNNFTLDVDKIIKSKSKMYLTVTNCITGNAEYFLNNDKETFFDVIKATSAIPLFYNKTVKLNGNEYVDGALTDSIPIQKAIDLGATEIYTILTQPKDYRKKASKVEKAFSSFYKKYPAINKNVLDRHIKYNKSLDIVETKRDDVRFINFRPEHSLGLTKITNNPAKINNAFKVGYFDTIHLLRKLG